MTHMRSMLAILAATSLTAAFAGSTPTYDPSTVIVRYKSTANLAAITQRFGGTIKRTDAALGFVVINLPKTKSVTDALSFYGQSIYLQRDIKSVEPNYYAYATDTTPNDPMFSQQYGPQTIGAVKAWDYGYGVSTVKVAVTDTGIQTNHPEFAGRILPGYNFIGNSTDANDDEGHGTHCSGIIAAGDNNSIGIAGLAGNVKLIPVKVLGSTGSGSWDGIASGIRFAADNGADIISMSIGGFYHSLAVDDACNYAWNKGVLLVAAAGNESTSIKSYPGAAPHVLCVGATDSADAKASFSNYGDWVHVAAPGVEILSTLLTSTYGKESGTSMACPHVAGEAALLLSRAGGKGFLTNSKLFSTIINNVKTLPGNWVIYGRVNLFAAIKTVNPGIDSWVTGTSYTAYSYPGQSTSTVSQITGTDSDASAVDATSLEVSYFKDKAGLVAATNGELNIGTPSDIFAVTAKFSATAGTPSTAFLYLLNKNTNAYDLVGSFAISSTAPSAPKTLSIDRDVFKASYYNSSTGKAKFLIRNVVATRLSYLPQTSFAIDQFGLTVRVPDTTTP